jgi:hypothetical protein
MTPHMALVLSLALFLTWTAGVIALWQLAPVVAILDLALTVWLGVELAQDVDLDDL